MCCVENTSRRRRLLWLKIGLIAGPLLLTFLAGEIYLRLLSEPAYASPGVVVQRSLRYERVLFARHALARRTATVKGPDQTPYEISERGYRGPAFALPKPPGVLRFLVLGGSAVFDQYAPPGQDWPKLTEGLLREAGIPEAEVINAGIPGHASVDSLGRFFTEGHTFGADYVLLYTGWNDIKQLRSNEPLLRTMRGYIPSADPRSSPRNRIDKLLCNTSQIYVQLRGRYYDWKLRVGPEGAVPEGGFENRIEEAALRQYRLNVELFVDAVRNVGAVPVLVTQARLVAPGNTASQRERIRYHYQKMDHDTLVDAYGRLDEILREVGAEKKARLIDPAASMTGTDRFYRDHVHLASEGSAELARIASRELAKLVKDRDGHR